MDKEEKALFNEYNEYIKKTKHNLIYKLVLCLIMLVCGLLAKTTIMTIIAIFGGIGFIIVLFTLIYTYKDPTAVFSFHNFKRNKIMKKKK